MPQKGAWSCSSPWWLQLADSRVRMVMVRLMMGCLFVVALFQQQQKCWSFVYIHVIPIIRILPAHWNRIVPPKRDFW